MPKFEKGHPKLGGREKGTPNKRTLLRKTIEEEFAALEGSEFRPLEKWIAAIEAHDYERAKAILDIFPYCWAKKVEGSKGDSAADDKMTEEEKEVFLKLARSKVGA